ncbi:MAG TPA: 50S ribosomal protein L23 [bacterium]|jgi:large subunit ribosomal protein L23|nr:50S ribosomal protein L23 [bacterium]HNW16319.1 50S ribosomal protein L23 [bacterium]HOB70865.1 50S ribosomal protein L23 [bacterium]HOG44000.1 50S ribosomal protein L23 [bacterium]HPA56046.1 50S ribosomal protein L23 [bacterium]
MKKEKHFDIIKRPLLTEKSAVLSKDQKQSYVFEVKLDSTKEDVKEAVEKVFNVKVDSVNTVVVGGKTKRVGRTLGKRSTWKKAYVTLKEGHQINLVEGL